MSTTADGGVRTAELADRGGWHAFKTSLPRAAWQREHPGAAGERADLFAATSFRSTEIEYLDFLHSLVRATKPARILETGTDLGVSAAALAFALCDNTRDGAPPGLLETVDHDPRAAASASALLQRLGLAPFARFHVADAPTWIRESAGIVPFDVVFLDSSRRSRLEEVERLREGRLLAAGSFVVFHDTSPSRVRDDPEDRRLQSDYVRGVEAIARECRGAIRLPLSRGLTVCQW